MTSLTILRPSDFGWSPLSSGKPEERAGKVYMKNRITLKIKRVLNTALSTIVERGDHDPGLLGEGWVSK